MRYELTEPQWRSLKPLLPRSGRGGQWKNHRLVINGILWCQRSGAPWRDLPARYGPWQTVYDRFNRWRKDGTWLRLLSQLQCQVDEQGDVDWDSFFVDSTVVRASRAAAGGGSKGGAWSRPTML